jgi:radical SAM superfamily enzyme YgiQ (UPF0313 family)
MPDVLFIDFPDDFNNASGTWSLGYRYMISSLRQNGFSAALLHPPAHNSRQALIDQILQVNSAIVGFTTYDVKLAALLEFIRDLRRAGSHSHITLGGLCASAIPGLILDEVPEVDSVVVGEGEQTIVDLARRVTRCEGGDTLPGVWMRTANGVTRGRPRPLHNDLDELPIPALDGIASRSKGYNDYKSNGCVPVLASRGCYGRCTFCCIQQFYRACPGAVWRGRRPAAVIDEISTVTKLSRARKVTFVDENFMGPGAAGRRHAVQIAKELACKDLNIRFNFGCRPNDIEHETIAALKKSGLAAVTLGIESMGNEALVLFNKRTTPEINYHALGILEELKIPTEITFIFFHPLTTLDEIGANLAFIDYVKHSQFAYFNKYQPFSEFVPFFETELTHRLSLMNLAVRTLSEHSIQYQDPRVALIARQVLNTPANHISRLIRQLELGTTNASRALRARLQAYYLHLNMVRLPALASELCKLLKHGNSPKSARVQGVLDLFAEERRTIDSLVTAFDAVASRVQ